MSMSMTNFEIVKLYNVTLYANPQMPFQLMQQHMNTNVVATFDGYWIKEQPNTMDHVVATFNYDEWRMM